MHKSDSSVAPPPSPPKLSWPLAAVLVALPVLLFAVYLKDRITVSHEPSGATTLTIDAQQTVAEFKKLDEQTRQEAKARGQILPPTANFSESEVIDQIKKGTRTLPTAKVLWVDDKPPNNQAERLALAAIGI
jgi:hypothetical protein